uniref:Uncharacterized protein n=1 Tax=Oryza rufipogon TaxID=4529 RepID=A0A0E0QGH3_ORYRU
MQHLLRLHVKASNQDELLRLESLQLPPELQTLQLTGKLTGGVLKSPLLFSANTEFMLVRSYRRPNPISLQAIKFNKFKSSENTGAGVPHVGKACAVVEHRCASRAFVGLVAVGHA